MCAKLSDGCSVKCPSTRLLICTQCVRTAFSSHTQYAARLRSPGPWGSPFDCPVFADAYCTELLQFTRAPHMHAYAPTFRHPHVHHTNVHTQQTPSFKFQERRYWSRKARVACAYHVKLSVSLFFELVHLLFSLQVSSFTGDMVSVFAQATSIFFPSSCVILPSVLSMVHVYSRFKLCALPHVRAIDVSPLQLFVEISRISDVIFPAT